MARTSRLARAVATPIPSCNFSFDEKVMPHRHRFQRLRVHCGLHANEDVLQPCFDDPVTFCCDQDDECLCRSQQNWDYKRTRKAIRA